MENSSIANGAPKLSPVQIYGDAGLKTIWYDAPIEAKPNGQKKIGGSRPAISRMLDSPSTHHRRANIIVC